MSASSSEKGSADCNFGSGLGISVIITAMMSTCQRGSSLGRFSPNAPMRQSSKPYLKNSHRFYSLCVILLYDRCLKQ